MNRVTPWWGRARQVHATGTLQLWLGKLGKVIAEAWGQVVAPAGRTGSSTPFQGRLLPNAPRKTPCLAAQNICLG
mgnify:CR=1 FL=1